MKGAGNFYAKNCVEIPALDGEPITTAKINKDRGGVRLKWTDDITHDWWVAKVVAGWETFAD